MSDFLYDRDDPTSTYTPLWTLEDVYAELCDLTGLTADGFQPELGLSVDMPFLVARCYEEVGDRPHWRRRVFIPDSTMMALVVALGEPS